MKKIIWLFLSLQTLLFGCAACSLMVPSVEVEADFKMQKKQLERIHFEWHFSDIYTSEVTTQFDKNKNFKLDPEEVQNISDAMLDYIKPKGMLTSIQYASQSDSEPRLIKPNYKNFKLEMVDGFLLFSYDAIVDLEISQDSSLSMAFEDDESFFAFIMTKLTINESEFSHTKNLYLFSASVSFIEKMAPEDFKESIETKSLESEKRSQEKKPILLDQETLTKEESFNESFLQESMSKIKGLFSSIKDEKNPMSYLLLLLFAFVYGVVHAMGPGHGKTLVASYFLANERSYTKALSISLAIGIVHTFSAFLLTLLIYFVLNTLLAQFLDNTVYYTTKVSAFIIIAIALYLIYKKYRLYKSAQAASQTPQFAFSTTAPHIESCGCSACKVDKNSTDFALIVSAGIIPCPGTTTIFIFAISMGLYYAGFISALVMSLGMSSVIFFSALLSTLFRNKFLGSSQRLKKYLEFGSLVLILSLGLLLLLA